VATVGSPSSSRVEKPPEKSDVRAALRSDLHYSTWLQACLNLTAVYTIGNPTHFGLLACVLPAQVDCK
jgi:hypothetical protein